MRTIKQFVALYMALTMLLLAACGGVGSQATETPRLEPEQNAETVTPQEQPSPKSEAEPTDEESGDEAEETSCFDERLVGSWRRSYDEIDNGTARGVPLQPGHIITFLPDGTYFTDRTYDFAPFDLIYINGMDRLIITAENGTMDFGSQILSYYLKYDAIEQNDAEKYSNINVTYEFFDYTKEMASKDFISGDYILVYDSYKNDGLRIHITADYQENPLNKRQVDLSYSYYIYLLNPNDFLEAYLVGDWIDDAGNKWNFSYVAKRDFNDFVFNMTDNSGSAHEGSYFSSYIAHGQHAAEEFGKMYIDISFRDFKAGKYMVEWLENNRLSLTSESGNLVLTRAAS